MEVEIVESSLVVPSEETPNRTIWLSNLDLMFSSRMHTPVILFYRPNGDPNFFSLEILKPALAKALVHFYPLAGRLGVAGDGRLEIKCTGEGVLLVVARCGATMDAVLRNFTPSKEVKQLLLPPADSSERRNMGIMLQDKIPATVPPSSNPPTPPAERLLATITRNSIQRSQSSYSMGIYLSSPKTEKVSEDGENARLRFGLSFMQGWRANMEDAHAAVPDLDNCTSFFAVYDGHGGKLVAKFCTKYLHTQVLKYDRQLGDLAAAIRKAFLRMDEMMRGQRGWRELAVLGDKMDRFTSLIEGLIWSPRGGYSEEHIDEWAYEEGPHSSFSGPSSGSTACVAVIRNNRLIVANAGDSRCVLSRKGQAISLSTDHKPHLVEEEDRILKAGGFILAGRVNGSINLSRAIGDMEFKKNKFLPPEKQIVTCDPDINIVELCDDDEFIVLACDGVWDCMSNQQVVDFIKEHIQTESRLSAICERVLDHCLAPSTITGEGCDNMTMILVQFKKPMESSISDT